MNMCSIPIDFQDSLNLTRKLPLLFDFLSVYNCYVFIDCRIDYNIVKVLLKMPHIFTNIEYTDMLHVYGFYDVLLLLLKNTQNSGERFPKFSIYYVKIVRFPVLSCFI